MRTARLIAALTAVALIIGCDQEDSTTGPEVVWAVIVAPTAIDTLIGLGDAVQFFAVALDANANPVPGALFTWTSSDRSVGVVDETGLVTAFGNGTTTVTAEEAGGVTGEATFKSATVVATERLTMDYDPGIGTPVSLTYDGSDYYTTYGGAPQSPILRFRMNGTYVSETTVSTDPRALLYNEADGKFYLKDFFLDWHEVNPNTGALTPLLTDIFADNQSSPTLAAGGTQILEQYGGSVRTLDRTTGVEQSTMDGFTVGIGLWGGEQAIATDGSYLFTIDPPTVYMFDMQGRLVTSFDVPNSAVGLALSYANDMLWVSPGPPTGTWYGYELVRQ